HPDASEPRGIGFDQAYRASRQPDSRERNRDGSEREVKCEAIGVESEDAVIRQMGIGLEQALGQLKPVPEDPDQQRASDLRVIDEDPGQKKSDNSDEAASQSADGRPEFRHQDVRWGEWRANLFRATRGAFGGTDFATLSAAGTDH